MVNSCAAYNCSNRFSKNSPYSFYVFPKDKNLREAWIKALGRVDYNPCPTARLCSQHFKSIDYDINSSMKHLKRHAVPSIFDFHTKNEFPIKQRKKLLSPSSSKLLIKTEAVETIFYNADDQSINTGQLCDRPIKTEQDITIDEPQIHINVSPTHFDILTVDNLPTSYNRKHFKPKSFYDINKSYLRKITPRKMKRIYQLAAQAILKQTRFIKKLKQKNYRSELKLKLLMSGTSTRKKYIYDTSEV